MALLVFNRSSNSMSFAATSREISLFKNTNIIGSTRLRFRDDWLNAWPTCFSLISACFTATHHRWFRRSQDSDLQNLASWISSKTLLRRRRWIPRFGRQHRETSLLEPIFWRAHEFANSRGSGQTDIAIINCWIYLGALSWRPWRFIYSRREKFN
jgi:hypothetical protein